MATFTKTITTLIGWILALFIVWAIIHIIRHPEDMITCPPDNFCSRSGPS